MNRLIKQIPNLFTLLNLVFGCCAIYHILVFFPGQWRPGSAINADVFVMPALLITLAGVVDFLDGFVARLFRASSEMGAQLDSLADVVSFGVAPGMIMIKLLELYFLGTGSAFSHYLLMPGLLVPCAAAWRLAKFNIDKEQTYYFKGVPTPAAGLLLAYLPFSLLVPGHLELKPFVSQYLLYTVIVAVCLLMVSNIPLVSLKFKNLSLKDNLAKFILLVIAIIAAIFFKWMAVPVVFVAYVLVSLIFKPNRN